MKILLLVPLLLLAGCGDPVPMNRETAKVYKDCQDKGWVPSYFSNGMKTSVDCEPNRDPIPMNADTSNAFQACLAQGKNAIYDAPSSRLLCLQEGMNMQMK